MTIFAVLMPFPQPEIAEAIKSEFPQDSFEITPTQWLVPTSGTAVELVKRLGIFDRENPSKPSIGNAVVFATSSYFGRGPVTLWDWIKAKLEATSGG
jgi:hypothetical protein